jgi:hypothetical protein
VYLQGLVDFRIEIGIEIGKSADNKKPTIKSAGS